MSEQPDSLWWIKYVLKKKDRIVSKTTSKYWQKSHKYGVRIPKSVKEALQIDKENGDTKGWDAIFQYMGNVRPAFQVHQGTKAVSLTT